MSMSRAKPADKKPFRVAAGPTAPGFARSMGESCGRLLRPLLPLLIFCAAIGGFSLLLWYPVHGEFFGLANSRDSVTSNRGRLTAESIRQAVLGQPRPAWIYKEDFELVANLGLFAVNHCVFEANLSRELAQKYETNSWVERVQAVSLRYPAQVKLEINWRKPAATVPQAGLVLDQQGYVLNLMCAGAKDLPRITNVPCLRTQVGQQVPEKDLLSALGLIPNAQYALTLKNLKIAEVAREASGGWRIVTEGGPVIEWGAFSDDPPLGEPRTHEKADSLRQCLSACKDPSALEYIKLYTPTPTFKDRTARTAPRANPAATRVPH